MSHFEVKKKDRFFEYVGIAACVLIALGVIVVVIAVGA